VDAAEKEMRRMSMTGEEKDSTADSQEREDLDEQEQNEEEQQRNPKTG
jgi:hypothetical protein